MSAAITTSNSDLFNKYLDNCKGEVKSRSAEGYYHVDVVAEAYSKGFSDGKQSGKTEFMELIISNEIEKFTQKANQIYILSKNFISFCEKNSYKLTALYINLDPSRPSVILSVADEYLNTDLFVEKAYSKLFEYKKIFNKLFNEHLDIGLISSNSLDEKLLKADGYGYIEKY